MARQHLLGLFFHRERIWIKGLILQAQSRMHVVGSAGLVVSQRADSSRRQVRPSLSTNIGSVSPIPPQCAA